MSETKAEIESKVKDAEERIINKLNDKFTSEMYVNRSLIGIDVAKELDNYYIFKDFLTSVEIKALVDSVKDMEREDGTISSNNTVVESYRKSKICWLPKIVKHRWIYDKIMKYASIANQRMWNFQITGMAERIQISEYSSDYEGKYDGHLDIGNGNSAMRKVSVVVQLSDPEEYEGGELTFNIGREPVTAPKDKGTMILFPSYIHHKVSPVTKGFRRSLVIWITGPAWM